MSTDQTPTATETDLGTMEWTREPQNWSRHGDATVAWSSSPTSDFWRHTSGVPPKHDGNALLGPARDGDFVIQAELRGIMSDLYDQFGIFVQVDEENWLKAGIEYAEGLWLSTVATKGQSDWARERYAAPAVTLRVARHDDTVKVLVEDAGSWRMIRELTLAGPARVGLYSCSPKGEGFTALARLTQPA
jgi:regulation of enolase protein 1 (concanavalin A-like superfamily)